MHYYAFLSDESLFICDFDVAIYRSLGKIQREKSFRRTPHTMKFKHTKIILPQRNRVVYNGL